MNVLIFGATGSAGASVLKASLSDAGVAEARVIVRRAPKATSAKLRVVLHEDFLNFDSVANAFDGVDACFFCLGVSQAQVPDEKATGASRTTSRWRRPGCSRHAVPRRASTSSAAAVRTSTAAGCGRA